MIVRDEEDNLPHCLESVWGIFDEIVVVDTGSTDRTRRDRAGIRCPGVRLRLDRRLRRGPERGALAATGDYVFWLDADDVVDPPGREKLRALLDRLVPEDEAAYVVRCALRSGPDGSGGETVVDHVRLFPLRDDLRWTYRVHEQIMPALATGRNPRPLDRPDRPPHRLCRPPLACPEARSRSEYPPGGTEGASRRAVHPLQPRRDRDRAA